MPTPDSSVRAPRRRSTLYIGLALTAAVTLLYLSGNGLLEVVELKTYDMRLHGLPAEAPDGRVAIGAIDEKSLARLGRWPWSRETLARVVERLDAHGARTIAFDVLFAETEGAGDVSLADKIARSGRTVLSTVFLYRADEVLHAVATPRDATIADKHEFPLVRHEGKRREPPSPAEPRGMLTNLPALEAAARYLGHINVGLDSDGGLRWTPLALAYRGRYYPSADVQSARAFGAVALTLSTNDSGIAGVELGERFIPTDAHGRALIRYYGPEGSFTTFPIADVLDANFDASMVKDRIVLIGPTAKGIGDIRVTPYGATFPGVEVRATIVQNLLRGDFLRRPAWVEIADVLLLLALGIGLSFTLPRLRMAAASGVVTALLIGYLGVGIYLFHAQQLWITLTYPLLLLVLLFMSSTLMQYFIVERERRQIKSAFQYYVPAKVVEKISANIESLKLGGEKRELTVLFSDIRGFTSMAETLAPEDLVHLLNVYLTRMTDQVFRHDGMLDKYIGDAVMAVFGAPIERRDHALLACRTALDMMRELHALQEQWRAQNQPVLDIGIGLNTGTMIVGNVGSENRFNYSVIGDAVNIGSRVESLNKQYGTHILLSEFTFNQVRDEFAERLRPVDVTQVKGREKSVRLYELIPDGQYPNLDWLADYRRAYRQLGSGEVVAALGTFERLAQEMSDPVSRYHLRNLQKR